MDSDTPAVEAPVEVLAEEPLPLLGTARAALVVAAVGWLLLAPGLALQWSSLAVLDPLHGPLSKLAGGGLLVLVAAGACLVAAAAHGVLAYALGKRTPRAWWAGVVVGVVLTPTGCLPVGLLLLAALVPAASRRAYGVGASP